MGTWNPESLSAMSFTVFISLRCPCTLGLFRILTLVFFFCFFIFCFSDRPPYWSDPQTGWPFTLTRKPECYYNPKPLLCQNIEIFEHTQVQKINECETETMEHRLRNADLTLKPAPSCSIVSVLKCLALQAVSQDVCDKQVFQCSFRAPEIV